MQTDKKFKVAKVTQEIAKGLVYRTVEVRRWLTCNPDVTDKKFLSSHTFWVSNWFSTKKEDDEAYQNLYQRVKQSCETANLGGYNLEELRYRLSVYS